MSADDNDSVPFESTGERLSDRDVGDALDLVARSSHAPGSYKKKIDVLIEGLKLLVDADVGGWAYSKTAVKATRPTPISWGICSRMTLRQQAIHTMRVLGKPRENLAIAALVQSSEHFTRSSPELVGADVWNSDDALHNYLRRMRISDFMHSIVKVSQDESGVYSVGAFICKGEKKPLFTDRDKKLVHFVVGRSLKYYLPNANARPDERWEDLPQALKEVMPLLLETAGLYEIASARHLSHDTVKKYASRIYRHFEVKNRYELIAAFRIQDRG